MKRHLLLPSIPLGLLLLLGTIVPHELQAVPILQLYLEGGVYNHSTESWELTPIGSSGGAPFRLWVIGNVDGPGGKGTIHDVRLAVAYDQEDVGLAVTVTPTLIGGDNLGGYGSFGGIVDYLSPTVFTPTQSAEVGTSLGTVDVTDTDYVVTNGGSPLLSDGTPLPTHGEYGPGTYWEEFNLGDFDQTTDSIGDFIGQFPTDVSHNAGHIQAYDISVTGGSGATLHFDVYDSIQGKNKARAVFAPFSHDGDGPGGVDATSNIVPEPHSVLIIIGLLLSFCTPSFVRYGRGWFARAAE